VLPPSALFTVDSFPLEPIEGRSGEVNKIKNSEEKNEVNRNGVKKNYTIPTACSYCKNDKL
jgi:hypothetical protein